MNEYLADPRQASAWGADPDRWQSIFDAIGEGSSERERERRLPFEQVALVKRPGAEQVTRDMPGAKSQSAAAEM